MGCWSHARRKFVEVTKGNRNTPTGNAGTALKYISRLYKIEKEAGENNLTPDALYQERQLKAVPILNEFKQWLDARVEQVPPKSLLGKAIHYTQKANGHDLYWYLKHLFEHLPEAITEEEFRALMPYSLERNITTPPSS